MSSETKILLTIGGLTIAILLGGFFLLSPSQNKDQSLNKVGQEILVGDGSYFRGPKDAQVTIVEFGDFQCPACASVYPTVFQIANLYKDNVKIVFRHFPLENIHKNAKIAALATEAAGEQGKFWEMHDRIFETQPFWAQKDAKEVFKNYAKELGLNEEQFSSALEQEKYQDKIFQDQRDGRAAGVSGTPTFFINGIKFSGRSFSDFKNEIEKILQSN